MHTFQYASSVVSSSHSTFHFVGPYALDATPELQPKIVQTGYSMGRLLQPGQQSKDFAQHQAEDWEVR